MDPIAFYPRPKYGKLVSVDTSVVLTSCHLNILIVTLIVNIPAMFFIATLQCNPKMHTFYAMA